VIQRYEGEEVRRKECKTARGGDKDRESFISS